LSKFTAIARDQKQSNTHSTYSKAINVQLFTASQFIMWSGVPALKWAS